MLEMKADIFLAPGPKDAICVTTNGVTKKNGHAVMGKGIALEANQRFGLSDDLGRLLRKKGNHVHDLGIRTDCTTGLVVRVVSYPTKHHWKDPSDPTLIQRSARELVALCNRIGIETCYLPRPGCANGGLRWADVRPLLSGILDDRFVIADLAD